MADTAHPRPAQTAKVDFLVDENGARLDVPDDSRIRPATPLEETVGGTGPTAWWRIGLVLLAAVALLLVVLQMIGGGPPTTDVAPGTPTTVPLNQPIAQ